VAESSRSTRARRGSVVVSVVMFGAFSVANGGRSRQRCQIGARRRVPVLERHPAGGHSPGRPDPKDQLKHAPRSVPSNRARTARPDTQLQPSSRRSDSRQDLQRPALPASHSVLPPDLGRWEKTGLSVHGSATMRSRASAARVEGGQFIEGVRHGFHPAAPANGLLRPHRRPGVRATSWNGFFAPGVLLAPLVVVTLTEGLSGLKAPVGMPVRLRHRTIAKREELDEQHPFAGGCPAYRRPCHP
jgi:hypothetical protein